MQEIVSRAAAKAAGSSRYYTGVPCKRGHICARFTANGVCVSCARDHDRSDYQANTLEHKARNRRWYVANKSRQRAHTLARQRRTRTAKPTNVSYIELADVYTSRQEGQHVDHIIPLTHPSVCGLHAPWNLQLLSAERNRSKHNHFDPSEHQFDQTLQRFTYRPKEAA